MAQTYAVAEVRVLLRRLVKELIGAASGRRGGDSCWGSSAPPPLRMDSCRGGWLCVQRKKTEAGDDGVKTGGGFRRAPRSLQLLVMT